MKRFDLEAELGWQAASVSRLNQYAWQVNPFAMSTRHTC